MESSPRLVHVRSRSAVRSESVIERNVSSSSDATGSMGSITSSRTVTVRKDRFSPRPASILSASQLLEPNNSSAPKYKIKARNKSGAAEIVDRRIQDLEISNKSLLAINSFLEKKLRHQERELNNTRYQQGHDLVEIKYTEEFSSDEDRIENESDDEITKQARRKTLLHFEEKQMTEESDRALHKCIYVTEQLLRDAEEAVNYEVRDEEIKLGGRIVHESDDDDAQGFG